jgi:hypothetical protein
MSFADLELLRQGVRLEPSLRAICDFLDKRGWQQAAPGNGMGGLKRDSESR